MEKEKIIKNLNNAVDVQDESMNSLRELDKQLKKERNALNLATAQGQKRLIEINEQIDKNNNKIKELYLSILTYLKSYQ